MIDIEKNIINTLGYDSYEKGVKYNKNYLRELSFDTLDDNSNCIMVDVESETFSRYYDTFVITKGNHIKRYSCTCPQYRKKRSCKHIAAVILKYANKLFKESKSKYELSNEILKVFCKDKEKQQVKLKIELSISDYGVTLKPKIGIDKYYIINESKLDWFKIAYLENGSYDFGMKFKYDAKKHYFSNDDEELLDFILGFSNNGYSYYSRGYLSLNERELNYLFTLLENKEFLIIRYGMVKGVRKQAPSTFKMTLEDDGYKLYIENIEKYTFIENNYKYVIYDNYLYVLPKVYSDLLKKMETFSINDLYIKKDEVNLLKDGLLNDIKDVVSIDEKITDFIIGKEPKFQLYFDMKKDTIICNLKIDYEGKVIDYFEDDQRILRCEDEEKKVLKEIQEFGFKMINNKIIMDDIESMVDFIEHKIKDLSKKYSIYTSKKIDSINVLKKTKIESNFSIGKDNIMTYNFSANNISTDELNKIVSSVKAKKRYYKLKNGNIVDLESNKELKDLTNVLQDLDLSKADIEKGSVEIPKYRAFYINSLKKHKYKNITTNYSFDKFINDFIKYKELEIKLDKHDKNILRDYQKDGVKWLCTLYKCDLGGILADEMGLGKSLQTICFIKQILKEKPSAKILIVCPISLVYNWRKEFDKFAPQLKYVTVSDVKKKRQEIIKKFNDFNIFITSYGLIRNDNDEYESKNFELCVIDEAQTIKNYQAGMTKEVKKIKARTKIALTGTPIENSVLELWSIFDFIMPGYLNSIIKFKEKFGIKDFDVESLEKIKELNYLISPFILRRKKKDVSQELPDKIENNIYLELPDVQKALYIKELKTCQKEMDELISEEGFAKARFKILQLLTKLRQICVAPSVMYDNYKYESVKLEKLTEIVKDYIKENHKVLIFSSFKRVIDEVSKRFKKEKISNYIIAGDVSGKKRIQLVDKFNNDDTNCFLITLKSGGTGINLTSADVVIHLDVWWNPQVENQATDRAHRIGQKNKVTVIKLITKGTIEERIIELQEKKKKLSDNLIENKDDITLVSKLNEEDMLKLLSFDEE